MSGYHYCSLSVDSSVHSPMYGEWYCLLLYIRLSLLETVTWPVSAIILLPNVHPNYIFLVLVMPTLVLISAFVLTNKSFGSPRKLFVCISWKKCLLDQIIRSNISINFKKKSLVFMWAWWSSFLHVEVHNASSWTVILYPKINLTYLGYVDPINIVFYNKTVYFSGWNDRCIGWIQYMYWLNPLYCGLSCLGRK